MQKGKTWVRDTAITAVALCACFGASLLMQKFNIPELVTTAFAFTVFLISVLTNGYVYGLSAALVCVLLVNYAFTFPYFAFDFTNGTSKRCNIHDAGIHSHPGVLFFVITGRSAR